MTDVERALRDLLERRAADMAPPVDLYPAVRGRAHRRRAVLGAGVAAALVAAGVPTALAATRSAGPGRAAANVPSTSAATPATKAADTASCPQSGRRSTAPRFPAQRAVGGSLGGDPTAVDAVLRAAWAFVSVDMGPPLPPLDPARARVQMVQRTADGWVVGLVTATDTAGVSSTEVLVHGPTLDRLVATSGGRVSQPKPLSTRFLGGDAYLGLTEGCGPRRLVVVAPPGSTARIAWIAGIAADTTYDRRTQPVPMRPDGVGVVDRPAGTVISVRVAVGGRTLRDDGNDLNPDSRRGPDVGAITRQLATVPGNGDPGTALSILRLQYSSLPVAQAGPQVLWKGQGGGATVAAAVTTLAGGAGYLWGGAVTSRPGIASFDGLIAADRLDGTAFVFRPTGPGGPWGVFFTGTRRVTVTVDGLTTTSTVTGGLVLPGNSRVTVTGPDGTPVPLIDVRTELTPIPAN